MKKLLRTLCKFKFLKTTLLLFLLLTILIVKPNAVKAHDSEVTCDGAGSCTLSPESPLFSISQDNFWYPGESIFKTLRITNSSVSDNLTISTNAQNSQTDESSCQLDKQLLLTIVGPNSVSWAGSLNDFYQLTSPLPLGNFSPNSFGDFIFTITLPQGTSNECQDQVTFFDLSLNFSGETINPTPSPTSTETTGNVSGAGVSTPVCNDTVPGGAPTLISAIAGTNSVTLTWNPAPDPVTYYLVTYGTSPGAQTYGNPNVGGHGATGYTVNGLSGGITYYFQVRAGNGCMPGPFSNELSTGVSGVVLAGPAAEFTPGVLGAETQAETTPLAMPQVLGTECIKSNYPWWIFLVLEFVTISLVVLGAKIKKWKIMIVIFLSVIIAVASQIIHEVMGCDCLTSTWCPKYLWINLAILLVSVIFTYYYLRKRQSELQVN